MKCHVNDISKFTKSYKVILFADNRTCIFTAGTGWLMLAGKWGCMADKDLIDISRWFCDNKLSLNPDKTTGNNLSKQSIIYYSLDLHINSKPIEIVNQTKLHGVFFDSNQTWTHDITGVPSNLSTAISVIYKI